MLAGFIFGIIMILTADVAAYCLTPGRKKYVVLTFYGLILALSVLLGYLLC